MPSPTSSCQRPLGPRAFLTVFSPQFAAACFLNYSYSPFCRVFFFPSSCWKTCPSVIFFFFDVLTPEVFSSHRPFLNRRPLNHPPLYCAVVFNQPVSHRLFLNGNTCPIIYYSVQLMILPFCCFLSPWIIVPRPGLPCEANTVSGVGLVFPPPPVFHEFQINPLLWLRRLLPGELVWVVLCT